MDNYIEIDRQLIVPLDSNPRKEFGEEQMAELAASIAAHGVLQPLIVRENLVGYELVAGERRWTAAGMAGLELVPCIVKELTDLEVAELQLVENIDRHQLSPLEESDGVCRLVALGMDQYAVAGRISRSGEWVQLRLDLPKLPEVARAALRDGKIGLGGAQRVLRLDEAEREDACQRLLELDGVLTERAVADLIRGRYDDPRRRRAEWEQLAPELAKRFSARAAAVADVEDSHNYVKAWGAGVGHYVNVEDEVGGLSVRPVESVVSWSDLVDAHGVETLLVCAGGDISLDAVVEVVDKRCVIDAERALREQGKAHTLGPRKVQAPVDEDETFEELAVRCVADAILHDPANAVIVGILAPVLAASEIQTAADDYVDF